MPAQKSWAPLSTPRWQDVSGAEIIEQLVRERASLSSELLQLIRTWPAHAIIAGSGLVGILGLAGLAIGKVLGRVLIAPDLGIVLVLISGVFHVMAWSSKAK